MWATRRHHSPPRQEWAEVVTGAYVLTQVGGGGGGDCLGLASMLQWEPLLVPAEAGAGVWGERL